MHAAGAQLAAIRQVAQLPALADPCSPVAVRDASTAQRASIGKDPDLVPPRVEVVQNEDLEQLGERRIPFPARNSFPWIVARNERVNLVRDGPQLAMDILFEPVEPRAEPGGNQNGDVGTGSTDHPRARDREPFLFQRERAGPDAVFRIQLFGRDEIRRRRRIERGEAGDEIPSSTATASDSTSGNRARADRRRRAPRRTSGHGCSPPASRASKRGSRREAPPRAAFPRLPNGTGTKYAPRPGIPCPWSIRW